MHESQLGQKNKEGRKEEGKTITRETNIFSRGDIGQAQACEWEPSLNLSLLRSAMRKCTYFTLPSLSCCQGHVTFNSTLGLWDTICTGFLRWQFVTICDR